MTTYIGQATSNEMCKNIPSLTDFALLCKFVIQTELAK